MSVLSETIQEELQARDIDTHILQAFMGWTDQQQKSFLLDNRKLFVKEVERMALFFDVSFQFIWDLSRRK